MLSFQRLPKCFVCGLLKNAFTYFISDEMLTSLSELANEKKPVPAVVSISYGLCEEDFSDTDPSLIEVCNHVNTKKISCLALYNVLLYMSEL